MQGCEHRAAFVIRGVLGADLRFQASGSLLLVPGRQGLKRRLWQRLRVSSQIVGRRFLCRFSASILESSETTKAAT